MGKKKAWMKNAHLFTGKNNQFRMKFNRNKHLVLNAKVKGTKGNPVVSKGVAYAKRKERWEKSQLAIKKANVFVDKRLLDPSMSLEDQATARFVRERQKRGKNNKFNLNDDEELTHKGLPLQDTKDWDNGASGSEEDEALDAKFVSKAHFGGFTSESNFEAPKSHKEIVEQLITDSKQKKIEKKIEKENYISSQEKVDKEWREIHLMSTATNSTLNQIKNAPYHIPTSETKDAYDISKLELKFEGKGSSISNTKTPEELAEIEEEKRIKREKERFARMADPSESKKYHESADALCDDYDYLEAFPLDTGAENCDTDSSVEMEVDEEESFEDYNIGSLFNIPQDFEIFKSLVKDWDPDRIYDAVEDILKATIRSKNKKVRSELINFFDILMQYVLYCCETKPPDTEKAGVLLPHLHTLAEAEPNSTADKFLECMDEEQQLFQKCKKCFKSFKSGYPRLQLIIILRFAGLIYSVSDRVHCIGLPAMDLMSDVLTSKFLRTHSNIVSRLLVSNIWLSYIKDSKRLVPEAITFLVKVLKLAIPVEKEIEGQKYDLVLSEKFISEDVNKLDVHRMKKNSSAKEKVAIISEVANQLNQFANLYTDLLSFKEFFAPTLKLCSQLPIEYYPSKVQESIKTFMEFVQNKKVVLRHLTFPKTKPKCLKMFKPAFNSKFSKTDEIKKKQKELKKVSQKIRKEERGMIREIRRDAQMIAAENLKKKLESDAERKRKVKEIYSQLSMQEGEYKKIMKKKS